MFVASLHVKTPKIMEMCLIVIFVLFCLSLMELEVPPGASLDPGNPEQSIAPTGSWIEGSHRD